MNNDNKKWICNNWSTVEYVESKKIGFEMIDSFLVSAPKNILDIGCGLAFESEMFQKKYQSNLYLLDGDFETTKELSRDNGYGPSSSMKFYSKIEDLIQSFNNRNMVYTFIDTKNIDIPANTIFDLVYSNVSCGFHYPLSTYFDLLQKHTDEDTIIVMDIREKTLMEQIDSRFKILDKKRCNKKISKCKLKLILPKK